MPQDHPPISSAPPSRSVAGPLATRSVAIATLIVIAIALAYLRFNHPGDHGFIPECPSRMLGFYCAGCGSTRATHHMLNLRAHDAWRYNPLGILLATPALAVAVYALVGAARRGRWPALPNLPAWAIWGITATVIAYSVARNVPVEALAPLKPPPAAATDSEVGSDGLTR